MKEALILLALAAFASAQLRAADTGIAATAINALGISLLAKTGKPDENALLSPYSIQEALAMTYAGAAGKTRDGMAAALHFPKESAELNASFAALANELAGIEKDTAQIVADSTHGGPREPVTLSVANRLYGQKGFDFHKTFLSLDEHGTEAAAATAVRLVTFGADDAPDDKTKEVHVDHPFIFAIQDCKSGACLFLGRVTDPR